MPDIEIKVRNKVASLTNTPIIICGNSDYTVVFDFDAEFTDYEQKTMRIIFRDKGIEKHYDILFTGDRCALPPMYRVSAISIGVYAGDVISSTQVIVPCEYGDVSEHADPPPDIYEQLLEYLENLPPPTPGGDVIGLAGKAYFSARIAAVGTVTTAETED